MKTKTKLRKFVRASLFLGIATSIALSANTGLAGAFSVDARNGAWGCGLASEGGPDRQIRLAVDRAIRRGGDAGSIRSAQFNLPCWTYVECSIGLVPGKGWVGNWAINGADSAAGLRRQNAYPWTIQLVRYWVE